MRTIGYWLAFAAVAAGMVAVAWPGAPADPATLINRADVIVILLMLAVLPRFARSRFGPVRDSGLTRVLRAGGFLALLALVLVKDDVERFQYAAPPGRDWLAGLWAGEILFLVVTAAYLAGLLALTARRPLAGPAVLAIGTGAGAAAGLVMFVLPPVGNPLHVTKTWLAVMHGLGWGVAVPLVLAGGIAAGLVAARKAPGRSQRARADAGPLQGLAAGLCAGAAAALLVSVAGVSAAALLPHQAMHFPSPVPSPPPVHRAQSAVMLGPQHAPPWLADFEVSLGDSAAGYLLVLLCFPLIGAGLGAWGGIWAAGRPGGGGDGGGGGGGAPDGPGPPPPGGRRLDPEPRPSILSGYLVEIPGLADLTGPREDQPAAPGRVRAARRTRTPRRAGAGSAPW
jgi:hypothetical protein